MVYGQVTNLRSLKFICLVSSADHRNFETSSSPATILSLDALTTQPSLFCNTTPPRDTTIHRLCIVWLPSDPIKALPRNMEVDSVKERKAEEPLSIRITSGGKMKNIIELVLKSLKVFCSYHCKVHWFLKLSRGYRIIPKSLYCCTHYRTQPKGTLKNPR